MRHKTNSGEWGPALRGLYRGLGALAASVCLLSVPATAQTPDEVEKELAECKSLTIIGGLPIDCDAAFEGAHLFPLQPHPEDVAWPTAAWDVGEMPAETAPLVDALIQSAMAGEKTDVMGETRAVVVIHRGRLVAEAYRDGFRPDTKQVSWSMAKSITQALVGRAVQLGLIEDIDAAMPTPFDADDPRAAITWRQWLNMTDGLDYKEINATSFSGNDVIQMMYGRGRNDVLAYVRDELPLIHEPGTHWNYSTAGFHLLSWALNWINIGHLSDVSPPTLEALKRYNFSGSDMLIDPACSGHISERQALEAWSPEDRKRYLYWVETVHQCVNANQMRHDFFAPIGMDAQPEFDPAGTFLGGSLVWASARDFAKLGYLYLRDGVWEDERLLPEGWVDFARTETPAENANIYGAGWWITAYGEERSHAQNATTPPWDAFHAGGHEGQTIWVVPSRDLVIVRLGLMSNAGENWQALYEWNQEIARAFPEIERE